MNPTTTPAREGFPHALKPIVPAQNGPDPELVEGIRHDAATLLSLIERCGVVCEPEFIATLGKLADNPVSESYTARARAHFDRDIEAMAIAQMTDQQVEQSWYRWRLAQEAAC